MTPCEKLGYKVGDEFEALPDNGYFEDGANLKLYKDDGSRTPRFTDGKKHCYLSLRDVRPLPITLRPGDYCSTANMTESEYHAVAAAFMAAGAREGEYEKDEEMTPCWALFGWCDDGGLSFWDSARTFGEKNRQLTPAQIIGASNAQTEPPEQEQTDVHIIDNLHAKRQARDVAEKQYQAALAEVREAYPWIRVDEKSEELPPSEWRKGDILECINTGYCEGARYKYDWEDGTKGKQYVLEAKVDRDGDVSVIDDVGDSGCPSAKRFRFIRRP